MATENDQAVSRRIAEEAFSSGNFTVIDEFVHPDYVAHDPSVPEAIRGREGVRAFISMYRTAFPDVHLAVEDLVAQGDKVVTRWVGRGTHRGELMGLAPTGRPAVITGITIDRYANGKLVESWANWDTLGLMQQIGAAPRPGSLGERAGKAVQRLVARRKRKQAGLPS